MTKDGLPSRIYDIRFFHGEQHCYLVGLEDAVAYGRRIAMFLNGENYSLGAYPALYIFLTPELEPGSVQVTDIGAEWWHRHTLVGVPADFPVMENASDLVKNGTVNALKTIRPDLSAVVDSADHIVRTQGDELRFLLRSHQTKRSLVEISFNVGTWPAPSNIFTSLTDMETGDYLDAPGLPIPFYSEAFAYNGPIRMSQIEAERSTFVRRRRPVMSKLVRRRG
ncbi:MAG: hypothetical protein ABL973_01370 [Micropepsaceae bacterium]